MKHTVETVVQGQWTVQVTGAPYWQHFYSKKDLLVEAGEGASVGTLIGRINLGYFEDGPDLNRRSASFHLTELDYDSHVIKIQIDDPGNSWERRWKALLLSPD